MFTIVIIVKVKVNNLSALKKNKTQKTKKHTGS